MNNPSPIHNPGLNNGLVGYNFMPGAGDLSDYESGETINMTARGVNDVVQGRPVEIDYKSERLLGQRRIGKGIITIGSNFRGDPITVDVGYIDDVPVTYRLKSSIKEAEYSVPGIRPINPWQDPKDGIMKGMDIGYLNIQSITYRTDSGYRNQKKLMGTSITLEYLDSLYSIWRDLMNHSVQGNIRGVNFTPPTFKKFLQEGFGLFLNDEYPLFVIDKGEYFLVGFSLKDHENIQLQRHIGDKKNGFYTGVNAVFEYRGLVNVNRRGYKG